MRSLLLLSMRALFGRTAGGKAVRLRALTQFFAAITRLLHALTSGKSSSSDASTSVWPSLTHWSVRGKGRKGSNSFLSSHSSCCFTRKTMSLGFSYYYSLALVTWVWLYIISPLEDSIRNSLRFAVETNSSLLSFWEFDVAGEWNLKRKGWKQKEKRENKMREYFFFR